MIPATSIVGYDNVALAQFMSPPLTTVNQPKEELGRLAVTWLLARINGEQIDTAGSPWSRIW